MKRKRIALIICLYRISVSVNDPVFILFCHFVVDVFIKYVFLSIYQILNANLFATINRILIRIEFCDFTQS